MSDAVAIAIVTAIPTIIAAVGAVIANVTRKKVNELEKTVKLESQSTRQHVQTCCHPDDMPPRSSAHRASQPPP